MNKVNNGYLSRFKPGLTKLTAGLIVAVSGLVMAGLTVWFPGQTQGGNLTLTQVSPGSVSATIGQTPSSWNWLFRSSLVSDCSSLSYSSNNERTSASRTYTISLAGKSHNNYLCVRVSNSDNTKQYSDPFQIDLRGPQVSYSLNSLNSNSQTVINATIDDGSNLHSQTEASTAIATTELSGSTSISYGLTDSKSLCRSQNSSLFSQTTDLSLKTGTVVSSKQMSMSLISADNWHGRYLCLKMIDRFGNANYAVTANRLDTSIKLNYRRNTSNQTITVNAGENTSWRWRFRANSDCSQNADDFATSTKTDNQSSAVVSRSGQRSIVINFGQSQLASFITDSDDIFNAAKGQAYSSSPPGLGSADPKIIRICLEAKDNSNNTFYQQYSIDSIQPGVDSVGQSGRLVWANAKDHDLRTASQTPATVPVNWSVVSYRSALLDFSGTIPDTQTSNFISGVCNATKFGRSGQITLQDNDSTVISYTSSNISSATSSSSVKLPNPSKYEAVCFKVTDQAGYHGYGGGLISNVTDTTPVIQAKRDLYSPKVSLSVDKGTVVTYRYLGKDNVDTSCDSSLLAGQSPTTSNIIDLTSITLKPYFCVEILWRANSSSNNSTIYQYVPVGTSVVDSLGPVISTSQSNSQLSASATDNLSGVNDQTWGWARLSNETDNSNRCQTNPTQRISNWSNGSRASLRTGVNHICLRVADKVGNYTYLPVTSERASGNPDRTAPRINLSQNQTVITATTEATDLPGSPDWGYVFINAKDSCQAGSFSDSYFQGRFADGSNYNNQRVCFRVADEAGNYGYNSRIIDLNRPVITLSQSGYTITASANESVNWQYYQSPNYPNGCYDGTDDFNSDNRSITSNQNQVSLDANAVGNYLCFRAQDQVNNFGHKIHQVSQSASPSPSQPPTATPARPTVSFSQTNNKLTAAANQTINSWHYLTYSQRPDCDSSNHFNSYSHLRGSGAVVNLDQASLNHYYCFRAINSQGLAGFGIYYVDQVNKVVTPTQPTAPTSPPDDLPPTLPGSIIQVGFKFDHNGNVIKASVEPASVKYSNYRYIIYLSDPTSSCDSTNKFFNDSRYWRAGSQVTLTSSKLHYYCWRATSSSLGNVYGVTSGYKGQIQPTQAVLEMTFNVADNTLTAQIADSSYSHWRYLIYDQRPDACNSSNRYFDGSQYSYDGHQVALTSTRSKYFCFRALNNSGQAVYGYYQARRATASSRPATTTASQPATTTTATRPTTTTTTAVSQPTVGVSFQRVSSIVSAYVSDSDGASFSNWSYLVYSQAPTSHCNDKNSYFTGSQSYSGNQIDISRQTSTAYYCFKAINSNDGRTAYGILKVVAPTVSQTGSTNPGQVTVVQVPASSQPPAAVSQPTQPAASQVAAQVSQPAAQPGQTTGASQPDQAVQQPQQPQPIQIQFTTPKTEPATTSTPDQAADIESTETDKWFEDIPTWAWITGSVILGLILIIIVTMLGTSGGRRQPAPTYEDVIEPQPKQTDSGTEPENRFDNNRPQNPSDF